MLSILLGVYVVIAVILLFSLTIFVHEFGHFLAARLCGLVVDTFAIGFGPALWKRELKGVTYKIGCIPIGGYVALPQLDPTSMNVVQGQAQPAGQAGPQTRQLPPVTPWKKIIVSAAGGAGNIVLAVGLAWVVYLTQKPSIPVELTGAFIGMVDPASAAYANGLRRGDTVQSVDGKTVKSWLEFVQQVSLSDRVTLRVIGEDGAIPREITMPTAKDPTLGLLMVPGVEEGSLCVVQAVQSDFPADRAGIKRGDIIRAVDGVRLYSREQMVLLIQSYTNHPVTLTLERQGGPVELTMTPIFDSPNNRLRIGIQFDPIITTPLEQIKSDATMIFRVLKGLVTPKEARHAAQGMGGPLMLLVMLWSFVQIGILPALALVRLINVNLAIINLLPIPVLDGGHILFALWQWVTRRPVHEKVADWLVKIFAALIISAMIFLVYRDTFRLWAIRRDLKAAQETATNAAPASTTPPAPAPSR
jgi:regulator of sigma E protease